MSNQTTTWEIKLKEAVLGPLNRMKEAFGGSQQKFRDMNKDVTNFTKNINGMGREFKRNANQMDDLLRGLKKRQADAFNTADIQRYQKAIDKVTADMKRFHSASLPPKQSKWQEFKKGFNVQDMASQIPGLGGMVGFATNPYTIAAGAALAIGVQSTKLALDYETGMAKINATAQLGADTLDKLKGRLIEIGSKSGGNFELMPQAYEKILSQTGKVNLSLDILETSVKGAKAGFTDIDTVAGALAQTLSIVGEQNTTANEVMDTLMKAKAVGAGEFKDFAQYMPQLIAAGSSLSVGFKDVAGVFSYMTAKGQSASDAAMLMQNAFTALQKGEIIKGMSKKGIDLFNPDGSRKNIGLVFGELSKKMKGLTDKGKTQFLLDIGLNDAQARNAFAVLTSDAEKFKKIMYEVNHALGETDKQIDATANRARTWGDIGDQLKTIGVVIGDFLLPVLDGALTFVIEFGRELKNIVSSEWWANFFGATDKKNAIFNSALNKSLDQNAWKTANSKFGEYKQGESSDVTKARNAFAVDYRDKLQKASSTKNKIAGVNDGTGSTPTENINGGLKGDGSGSASGGGSSSLSGSGGGGGRNLTQNLYITIHVKKASEVDDGKLQSKLKDIIVDAGRDGLVTIGT